MKHIVSLLIMPVLIASQLIACGPPQLSTGPLTQHQASQLKAGSLS